MKVAIFIDQFTPGACPKFSGAEVKYLREKGYEAEIVAIMEGGLPEESYQFQAYLDGVPIRYLSRERRLLKIFNFKLPMFAFFSMYHLISPVLIPKVIKRKEYDVIIAHTPLACFAAHQLWKRRGIPYINFMWDPMSFMLPRVYGERLPKRLVKLLTKVALFFDRILANNSLVTLTCSQPHVNFIRSYINKDVEEIYPGCFPVEQIPEKRGDYVLALDRWDIGNLPHMFLDVWERLSKKVELRVAGFWWPEELRQSFIKLRDEKGLTDLVKILGPVTEEELSQLYLNARAFVHPINETFHTPVLEAAGYGCPTVMPNGFQIFNHGIHGFFAAEGHLDEFAEYVDRLVADERLAWKMGYESWKVAREHTWEQHARKVEQVVTKYV